jgi:O-antigen ligase
MILFINLLHFILSYDTRFITYLILVLFLISLINYVGIKLGFQSEELAGERLQGLASNPNSLGVKSVYSVYAILLSIPVLSIRPSIKLVIAILLIAIAIELIIGSASRKSLISLVILLGGYIFIVNSNKPSGFKADFGLISFLFLGAVVLYFGQFLLTDTIMAQRFESLEESGGVKGDIRYSMVTFGLELFLDNPIFGVGINNYRAHSPWGMYSHNDYIESLTSTGLIGFILYQGSVLITLVRSYKLFKISKIQSNRFYFAMIILGTLTIKIIGLGQIIYVQTIGMITLAAFASYSWIIEKRVRRGEIEL